MASAMANRATPIPMAAAERDRPPMPFNQLGYPPCPDDRRYQGEYTVGEHSNTGGSASAQAASAGSASAQAASAAGEGRLGAPPAPSATGINTGPACPVDCPRDYRQRAQAVRLARRSRGKPLA